MHAWKRGAVGLAALAIATAGPGAADQSNPLLEWFYAPQLSTQDQALYRTAFASATVGDWAQSRAISAQAEDSSLGDLLLWLQYLEADGGGTFDEIAAFIESHPAWPLPITLSLRAETAMGLEKSPGEVLDWFERYPPVSGAGMVRLARAHEAIGNEQDALAWARRAWTGARLNTAMEAEVVAVFGSAFTPADHAARLDYLIWEGLAVEARRNLRIVDEDARAVAWARIALMQRAGGVDTAIAAVPEALLSEPGLVFERMRWRRRAGKTDDAVALLLPAPVELGRPGPWWTERKILIRTSLGLGNITDAYQLSRDHGQLDRANIADAEWLAGWIALSLLEEPANAYRHFTRQHANVRFPVSLARGAYWAGRAAEAMAEITIAQSWYTEAARYQTTYYGQLAQEALGGRTTHGPQPMHLPKDPMPDAAELENFSAQDLVRIVQLLVEVGEEDRLRPFILRLADQTEAPGELFLVARLANAAGRPDLSVAVAKRAYRQGTMLASANYPQLITSGVVEPALVLAVARQESEFNQRAVSPAGAQGLMQLMPATARAVARDERLAYDRARLTDDPAYNLRLGGAHLAELIERFDGSYLLAVAAYNAGQARVEQWLRDYGDPREDAVNVIDWVETIPFRETRNYVQRVLENLQVYRSVLAGRPTQITLVEDLTR